MEKIWKAEAIRNGWFYTGDIGRMDEWFCGQLAVYKAPRRELCLARGRSMGRHG